MSRLRLNLLAVSPSAPAAGKEELYGLTADGLLRSIDSNGVIRKVGNVYTVTNTADVGPTAGVDFYIPQSAVPVAQLVAGSLVRWRLTGTKTAACTGTPTFTIRCGTAQSVVDTSLGAATLLAQTAAADTGWWEIEAVLRAATATGTLSWALRAAHKNATTGFANAVQDQIFNGTSAAFNFTTAGLYLGLSVNPTATTANGVWTFQTVSTLVAV